MKKITLLISLGGLAFSAAAQSTASADRPRHTVSVGALGLAANLGLEYEWRPGRHFALGLQGARYFSAHFSGWQAALLGRYYFRGDGQPGGLFVQGSVGLFSHQGLALADQGWCGTPPFELYRATVRGRGGSLGLGHRWALGPRWSVNSLLGLKIYVQPALMGGPVYVKNFNDVGQPGSALDAQLSLGYSF